MKAAPEIDWDRVAARVDEVRDTARRFAAEARTHSGDRLRDIRLFGSAARGDWQVGSDVDVLLLLDEVEAPDRAWTAEHATNLGLLGNGILLSTVTLRARDFEDLRRKERLFAREIDTTGIPL